MPHCDFCSRTVERRLWARRWPVRDGRRQRDGVQDVRLSLCGEHLALRIHANKLLVKDDWAHG